MKKIPIALQLHKKSKVLELSYGTAENYRLSAEFLRVYSPSAEVRGHGNPTLQTGKKHVGLISVTNVGRYAIRLHFDDGHDSGIYDWDYLYTLCIHYEAYWDDYLSRLHEASEVRDPEVSVLKIR